MVRINMKKCLLIFICLFVVACKNDRIQTKEEFWQEFKDISKTRAGYKVKNLQEIDNVESWKEVYVHGKII